MKNDGTKIIFDDDPQCIISTFITTNVSDFGILTFAKTHTIQLMQELVNQYIDGQQKNIPMYVHNDGHITIVPNETTKITFGSFVAEGDDNKFVYVTAQQEDEHTSNETTMEVYPPKGPASCDDPDYVICNTLKTEDNFDETSTRSFFVYRHGVQECINESTPAELCSE